MRCQEAFEAMSARFDGELEASDVAPLEQHLTECAHCRAELDGLARAARRLRGAAREQPGVPAALEKRITRMVSPTSPRRTPFVFGLAFLGATASFASLAMVARARPAEPARGSNPDCQSCHSRGARIDLREEARIRFGALFGPAVRLGASPT